MMSPSAMRSSTSLVSSETRPLASSALSGIASSVRFAVLGKFFPSVASFSMWFAAESVGIQMILAPILIA